MDGRSKNVAGSEWMRAIQARESWSDYGEFLSSSGCVLILDAQSVLTVLPSTIMNSVLFSCLYCLPRAVPSKDIGKGRNVRRVSYTLIYKK